MAYPKTPFPSLSAGLPTRSRCKTRTPSPPPLPPVPQNTPFHSNTSTAMSSPNGPKQSSPSAPSKAASSLAFLISTLSSSCRLLDAPKRVANPSLTSQISAFQFHPTIEAALHLLNGDLVSAHFLVRHMAAPPAVEGMLLHSILHRIEGDFENARAWAGDVGDACGGWVPKSRDSGRGGERLSRSVVDEMGGVGDGEVGLLGFIYEEADGEKGWEEDAREVMLGFIDEVERFRKEGVGDEDMLEGKAREELQGMLEWCRMRFGDGRWVDASLAWARPGQEVREIGEAMVSGGKGWREF